MISKSVCFLEIICFGICMDAIDNRNYYWAKGQNQKDNLNSRQSSWEKLSNFFFDQTENCFLHSKEVTIWEILRLFFDTVKYQQNWTKVKSEKALSACQFKISNCWICGLIKGRIAYFLIGKFEPEDPERARKASLFNNTLVEVE